MGALRRSILAVSSVMIVTLTTVTAGRSAFAVDYDTVYPNEIQGVAALTGSNAWAVGSVSDGASVLIEHWNGASWATLSSPISGQLFAVGAASASKIWAVGGYSAPRAHQLQSLILFWNGSAWSRQSSPSPSSLFNPLMDVSVLSSSDAWAVGYYVSSTNTSQHHALALHWDGTKWARVSAPGTELYAVDAVSHTSVWAAGFQGLLHWNGVRWSAQYSQAGARFFGLSHVSSTNAWAVGDVAALPSGAKHTYVLHWNGTKWSHVGSPSPTFYNSLTGVKAVSASDVWAVGCHGAGADCSANDTLILHWDGTKWSTITAPHPGSKGNHLADVSATGRTGVWAVGADSRTQGSSRPLILHWNGSRWTTSQS